jgi:hypothetical protein
LHGHKSSKFGCWRDHRDAEYRYSPGGIGLVVVDGSAEFVGSNWNRAVAAIAQAARAPKANVQITTDQKKADAVSLRLHVSNLPAVVAQAI